ncbi:Signal peptidase I [Lachnospiraceae bacterium TWA4]|nr:Signal peptidase I [Lachnospiraceae bacterium TWA4]
MDRELRENGLRRFTKGIVDVLVILVLALFISRYVADPMRVIGLSMKPTLNADDRVLVNRISNNIRGVRRLEVVVFESDGQEYIKRVIGLPGECVQIKDGIVYIDDEKLDGIDKILQPGLAGNPIRLGEDEYFVLGDNTTNSEDSRYSKIGNIKKNK